MCNAETSEHPQREASRKLLERAQLFDELSPCVLDQIAGLAMIRTYAGDAILFRQCDPGDALYIVESGLVEISFIGPSGRKLVLNYMHAGDVFGEIALLDGGERTATATTVGPSTLYRIARSDALALLADKPEVAAELIHVLCRRLRWISSQLEDRALLPIPARTAKKLLLLVERMDALNGHLEISQNDLADIVGATRESVNRTLSQWRDLGWIELARGTIRVKNVDDLAAVVDSATFGPRS